MAEGGNGSWDYIIVGAGSAGCVLATRLSEDPQAKVLLLEAGGTDWHPLIHVPLGVGKLHEHELFDWGLHTEPEPALGGRSLEAMRGKVLGGSSSVNIMACTRGDPGDYDRWARQGAPGWGHADVLPWFRRSERWEGGASEYRGGDGPTGVQWSRFSDPLNEAWLQAGREAGYPMNPDFNGERHEGFGRGQCFIDRGRRSSAAVSYLRPVRARRNLKVVTRACVTRIVIEGGAATGVEYRAGGRLQRASAAGEVIVSAGTFNSPQVLMLSGIGPAAQLERFGIPVLADLPVGRNLQDHVAVALTFARRAPGPFHAELRADRMAASMLRAWLAGTGPATMLPSALYAFVKSQPRLDVPDIEFMFRCAPQKPRLWFPLLRPPGEDGYGIRPALLHPCSRGEVTLRSADPAERVRILFNLLSDPADMATLLEGYERARDLALSGPLAPFRGRQLTPGPEVRSRAEVEAWIRRTAVTVHHPAGTCRIGNGPDAVVDPALRVHGIARLRVADASVMPDLVSAHINACVLMIAERAADLVRGQAMPAATPIPTGGQA
ncbi:MAG: GMC family oxidoreductase N-terminal domain-containing protein [Burkholderiales bacterium]|nr:GMC family oxidoreductase N-terminal domain-containing protein [Burkholderiales bacterium]